MVLRFLNGLLIICLLEISLHSYGGQDSYEKYFMNAKELQKKDQKPEIKSKIDDALNKIKKTTAIRYQDKKYVVIRRTPTKTTCALAYQQFMYDKYNHHIHRDIYGILPTHSLGMGIIIFNQIEPNSINEKTADPFGLPAIEFLYGKNKAKMTFFFKNKKELELGVKYFKKALAYCKVWQEEENKKLIDSDSIQISEHSLPPLSNSLQAFGQQENIHSYLEANQPKTYLSILNDGQEAFAARLNLMDKAFGPNSKEMLQTHIYMADPAGMVISHKLINKRMSGADVSVTIDAQSVFWDFRDIYYNSNTAIMFNNLMAWGVKVRGFNCFDKVFLNKVKWKLAQIPSNGSQYWEELIRSFNRSSKDPIYNRIHQKVHIVTNSDDHYQDEIEDAMLALMANNITFDQHFKRSWDFSSQESFERPKCFNPYDPIKDKEDYFKFAIKHTYPYLKRKPKTIEEKSLSHLTEELERKLAILKLYPSFYLSHSTKDKVKVQFDKNGQLEDMQWPVKWRSLNSFGPVRNILTNTLGKTGIEHFAQLNEAYQAIIDLEMHRHDGGKSKKAFEVKNYVKEMIIGGRNIGADYFELTGKVMSSSDEQTLKQIKNLREEFLQKQQLASKDQAKNLESIRMQHKMLMDSHHRKVINRWRDMEGYVIAQASESEIKDLASSNMKSYKNRFFPLVQGLFIQNRPIKDKEHNIIKEYIIALIHKAKSRIRILNSYYCPDKLVVDALEKARQRGVDIEIITNDSSVNDLPPVSALTNYWSIEHFAYHDDANHIKLYYFDGKNSDDIAVFGTNHSKFMIIDDWIGAIMSWNMDGRSMGHEGFGVNFPSINQEDAFIFGIDPSLSESNPIADLLHQFEADRSLAKPVSFSKLIEGFDIKPRLIRGKARLWREKRKGVHPNKSWKELKTSLRNLYLGLVFPGPSFF